MIARRIVLLSGTFNAANTTNTICLVKLLMPRYETGSEQTLEFADPGKNSNIQRDPNLANSGSVGPVEDVSEDFSHEEAQT